MTWLRIGRAAKYADVSRDTFRNWMSDGIPSYTIGSVTLINPADIDNYIKARGENCHTAVHASSSVRANVKKLMAK